MVDIGPGKQYHGFSQQALKLMTIRMPVLPRDDFAENIKVINSAL